MAVVNIGLVQGIILHKQGHKSGQKWAMHYRSVIFIVWWGVEAILRFSSLLETVTFIVPSTTM